MVAKFRYALGVYVRGVAMGAADVVPGVSGGTIAFITGIYARLIESLTAIDLESVRLLLKLDIQGLWRRINGNFLLLLLAGILTSIFSLAHVIGYLLANHPIQIWSVFFGLIAASAFSLLIGQGIFRLSTAIFFLLGAALVILISVIATQALVPTLPIVFLAGVIAISAMLLPGLSGSFLLLLFGLYEPTLEAVKALNMLYLLSFGAGALTGLITFSHLINWLLKHYYANTLMFLIGLLLGSLYAVWPWRSLDAANSPISPLSMPADVDPMIASALACMILSIVTVLAIELVASKLSGQASPSKIEIHAEHEEIV